MSSPTLVPATLDAVKTLLDKARRDLGPDLAGYSPVDLIADNLPLPLADIRAYLAELDRLATCDACPRRTACEKADRVNCTHFIAPRDPRKPALDVHNLAIGTVLRLDGVSYAAGTFNPRPAKRGLNIQIDSAATVGPAGRSTCYMVRETGRKQERKAALAVYFYDTPENDGRILGRVYIDRVSFGTHHSKPFFVITGIKAY